MQVKTSGDSPANRMKYTSVRAHNVPRERFPDFEKADVQEALNSEAAKLTEDLEEVTALSGPEDEDSVLLWRDCS